MSGGLGEILITMTKCLLLTIAAEGIIIVIFTKDVKMLWRSVLCNLLTNPALNGILFLLTGFGIISTAEAYYVMLAVMEIIVVAVEALCYRLMCSWNFGKALAVSAALNAASFAVGLLIFW